MRDFSARISITSGSPTGSEPSRAVVSIVRSRVRPAVNGVRSVRSTAVRVVMSSTSDRSSSTARSSRLRLERLDVARAEASRDDDRDRGARHRREQDRAVLACRRQQDQQAHQAAADRVAESIEADVDDRLGRALLVGRNRRVENLVAGSEQRAAKHRLPGARDAARRQGREDSRPDEPARGKRQRRRARRSGRDPRRSSASALDGRLDDERQQTDAGVVQREEAEQALAASERLDGLGLEDVVDQRGANRAEQHERGQVAQIRRSRQHVKARLRRYRGQIRRCLVERGRAVTMASIARAVGSATRRTG